MIKDLHIYDKPNATPARYEGNRRPAAAHSYRQVIPTITYSMIDEHNIWLNRGIPAVDLIDFGYRSRHTLAINAARLEAVDRADARRLETRAKP